MAYEIGFVDNLGTEGVAHHQLLEKIRQLASGRGTVGTITGVRTGNGTITGVMGESAAITETWTVTLVTPSANGGMFSVVGSVSGTQNDATVGVLYNNGLVTFTINDGSTDFAVNDQFIIPITQGKLSAEAATTFVGVGNGALTRAGAHEAGMGEKWTIKLTTVVVNGGVFSVTGSVSGAQADATVGSVYDNGKVRFLISDGTTDFALNDTFTYTPQTWKIMRYDKSSASRELVLRGGGLSGADQIFVGFRTYEDTFADYYNLAVAGFTGYVPGNTWSSQPGFVESGVPAHNQSISYWIVLNGQRIAFALKVGTPVYESGYVGKMLPYAMPSQYPYPIVVGGMLTGASATRYSDTTHTMAFKGNRANLKSYWVDGTYKQPSTWPWGNNWLGGSTMQLRDTNNNYPVLPVVLYESAGNVFGELDGVGYVSNFNNTVESVVQVGGSPVTDDPGWTVQQRVDAIVAAGGVAHICLQDVARTSFNDYFTLRLT